MNVRKTSRDVYHRIESEGLLSKNRWEVYKVLFHHGPLTSGEIYRLLKMDNVSMWKGAVCARVSDLNNMQCVYEVGVRECSVTGEIVTVWDVNADLPRPLPKNLKQSWRQRYEALELELRRKDMIIEHLKGELSRRMSPFEQLELI